MHRPLLISAVIVSGLLAVWLTNQSKVVSPQLAATVGDDPVTLAQYRADYTDFLLKSGLQDELRLRHSFLDRMIDMRLLTLYARDSLSIEEDPAFQLEMERARRKLLIEAYLRQVVYDTLAISEQDLEEMFVRVNTQLKASHLYARTLEEAEHLKSRLDHGESFDDLASEVFADPDLAESGGELGYFGFDEMDPQFEDAAFNMEVGSVSDPIQTSNGYSIIRLEDRAVRPLLTEYEFATRRDRIRTYVLHRKHVDARRSLRDAILSELRPKFDEDVLGCLVRSGFPWDGRLSESENCGPWRTVLVTSKGELTIGQLAEEAKFMSESQLSAMADLNGAREVVKGLAVRLELLDRAQAHRVGESTKFSDAMTDQARKLKYDGAWSVLRARTGVPDDSIRSYLERHREDFVVPERVYVREIVVESNDRARSLMKGLTALNFAEVAATSSMRPGAAESGGELGFVTRKQMGVLADRVFAAEAGSLVGPIEVLGRYAIFLVGEKEPARPASFAEARDEIEHLLFNDAVRAGVEKEIARVRHHYTIERFLDSVESLDLRKRVST